MKTRPIRDSHDFSIAVSQLLQKSGKSYREAAAGSNVSHSILHGVTADRYTPRLDTAIEVLNAFGMELVVRKRRNTDG